MTMEAQARTPSGSPPGTAWRADLPQSPRGTLWAWGGWGPGEGAHPPAFYLPLDSGDGVSLRPPGVWGPPGLKATEDLPFVHILHVSQETGCCTLSTRLRFRAAEGQHAHCLSIHPLDLTPLVSTSISSHQAV